MNKTGIFTTTGNAYWHFHLVGVGVILNYHISSMQVMMTCEHTGILIDVQDYKASGGLTQDEFKELCSNYYLDAVDKSTTINLDYMDNPTIVGCIGVDFDLIKN